MRYSSMPEAAEPGPTNGWLIILTPPKSLLESIPRAAAILHTKAGYHKHSEQGVTVPLQRTLAAQSQLIARDYGFPSPMGLSLYLHLGELCPRLTDESWSTLFYDPRPISGCSLPICAHLSFEIEERARYACHHQRE
jgi:hypothetical protein